METHNLRGGAKMYHTMTDVVKDPIKNTIIECAITGLCKGIKKYDTVIMPEGSFIVDSILEQRHHKGKFENESDAKDAFFKATLKIK